MNYRMFDMLLIHQKVVKQHISVISNNNARLSLVKMKEAEQNNAKEEVNNSKIETNVGGRNRAKRGKLG